MIPKILDLMTAVTCLFIIYQDFKNRSVSVYILACFVALALLQLITNYQYHALKYAAVNMAILSIIFILQTVFVSLKKKRLINPVNKTIGLFDILLLTFLCCWFSPKNFIYFFIGSLTVALFHVLFQKLFVTKKSMFIPLAAYICIFFLVCIGVKNIFELSFYDDSFLRTVARKII
jgi:hypothetical protein